MSTEITEAIGFMTNDNYYANQGKQSNTQTPGLVPSNSKTPIEGGEYGITISHCASMYPWQKNITKSLLDGNDAYILVPPGGGKTTPYTCYWAQKIMGFNSMNIHAKGSRNELMNVVKRLNVLFKDRKSIPKVLVGVPTRTLTMLQYDDFVNSFIDMFHNIMTFVIRNGSQIKRLGLTQKEILTIDNILDYIAHHKYNNTTAQQYAMDFKSLFKDRISAYAIYSKKKQEYEASIRISNPDSSVTSRIDNLEQDVEKLANQIRGLDERLNKLGRVVFREFGRSFIAARNKVDKTGNLDESLIIIGVYESCREIYKKYHNKIKTIVIDEAHLTQQSPSDPLNERTENITSVLYPILKHAGKDTRIMFMTGTINPDAANQMATFMNTCFNRNFKVFSEASAGNAAKITVVPDNNLSNDDTLVKILLSNKPNNVIVLFSKARIESLVRKALHQKGGSRLLSDIDREITQSRKNIHGFYTKHSNYNDKPDYINNSKRGPGATELFDPLQKAAVAAGFGFIYRPKDNDPNEDKKVEDQKIVLNLFKRKKIHTIIGTDALGIGINMDVQRMFIPKAEKFTGTKNETIPVSDLSQLLNRVGRSAFKRAIIYTTSESMKDVSNALNAGIDNFEKRGVVTFGSFDPRLHATIEMVQQIIKELIKELR